MKPVTDKPKNINGGYHFKDGFRFYLHPNRMSELRKFLEASVGPIKTAWRFHFKGWPRRYARHEYGKYPGQAKEAIVSFRDKRHAVYFKLAWNECEKIEKARMFPFNQSNYPNNFYSMIGMGRSGKSMMMQALAGHSGKCVLMDTESYSLDTWSTWLDEYGVIPKKELTLPDKKAPWEEYGLLYSGARSDPNFNDANEIPLEIDKSAPLFNSKLIYSEIYVS